MRQPGTTMMKWWLLDDAFGSHWVSCSCQLPKRWRGTPEAAQQSCELQPRSFSLAVKSVNRLCMEALTWTDRNFSLMSRKCMHETDLLINSWLKSASPPVLGSDTKKRFALFFFTLAKHASGGRTTPLFINQTKPDLFVFQACTLYEGFYPGEAISVATRQLYWFALYFVSGHFKVGKCLHLLGILLLKQNARRNIFLEVCRIPGQLLPTYQQP